MFHGGPHFIVASRGARSALMSAALKSEPKTQGMVPTARLERRGVFVMVARESAADRSPATVNCMDALRILSSPTGGKLGK